MGGWKKIVVLMVLPVLGFACTRPVLKEHAQPSRAKDQYLRVKKVAIFPFENYSDTKDAEKTIDSLVIPALRDEEIFETVEDTRFTRDVMKKLKITATDILDKEVLKKLGDEMNVQGIIYGKVLVYGKGKEKDSASQVTMDMALVEPSTGVVLWVGNVSAYGGLTVGKVFGVTEGKTDIEVARDAIRRLTGSLSSEVRSAREKERKGVVAELKKEEEVERARLEKLKGETGKIQEQVDKAKAEAKSIKDTAAKEAEAVKSELEMQKVSMEAEKAKAITAQQEAEQEKLKVELEKKKIAEDLKKIDDERKKLEEARKKAAETIKEEPVKDVAPQAPPSSVPVPVLPAPAAPAPAPPAARPAAPASEAVPASPPGPAPSEMPGR